MPLTDIQRAFLDRPRSAVVATYRRDGTAVQSVVWYVLDGDDLWFSCSPESAKARHLRRDARISVLVLSDDGRQYLAIEGRATVTEDIETPDRLKLMRPYIGEEGARRAIEARPLTRPNARVRVHPDRVFAYNLPA